MSSTDVDWKSLTRVWQLESRLRFVGPLPPSLRHQIEFLITRTQKRRQRWHRIIHYQDLYKNSSHTPSVLNVASICPYIRGTILLTVTKEKGLQQPSYIWFERGTHYCPMAFLSSGKYKELAVIGQSLEKRLLWLIIPNPALSNYYRLNLLVLLSGQSNQLSHQKQQTLQWLVAFVKASAIRASISTILPG